MRCLCERGNSVLQETPTTRWLVRVLVALSVFSVFGTVLGLLLRRRSPSSEYLAPWVEPFNISMSILWLLAAVLLFRRSQAGWWLAVGLVGWGIWQRLIPASLTVPTSLGFFAACFWCGVLWILLRWETRAAFEVSTSWPRVGAVVLGAGALYLIAIATMGFPHAT